MSDKFLARGINLDILLQRLIEQAINGGRVVSMKALVTVLVEDYPDDLKRFIKRVDSGELTGRLRLHIGAFGGLMAGGHERPATADMPQSLTLSQRSRAYAESWVRHAIENFQSIRLPEDIQRRLDVLYVSAAPEEFMKIRYDLITDEVAAVALRVNGLNLERIPHKVQTQAMVTIAVTQEGFALWYVAPRLINEALCMAAVASNGNALSHVPKPMRTANVCATAVRRSGAALRYVPENLHTPALHAAAIKQDPFAIRYVPKDALTEKMCLSVVKKNGASLGHVHKEFRTPRVCLEAIKNYFEALTFVPTALFSCEAFKRDLLEAFGGKVAFRAKLAQTKLNDVFFNSVMEDIEFDV